MHDNLAGFMLKGSRLKSKRIKSQQYKAKISKRGVKHESTNNPIMGTTGDTSSGVYHRGVLLNPHEQAN